MAQCKLYIAGVKRLRACSLLADGKIPGQRLSIAGELSYKGPQEDEFASFALIIRKFISPKEDIYFNKIAKVVRRVTGEGHRDIHDHIRFWQEHFNKIVHLPVMEIRTGIPSDWERLLDINPELRNTFLGEIVRGSREHDVNKPEILLRRQECVDIYLNGLLFHADREKRKLYDHIDSSELTPIVILNARDTLLMYVHPIVQLEFAIKTLTDRWPDLLNS